jgi:uncharacterized protein YyaL (SSP411 family)
MQVDSYDYFRHGCSENSVENNNSIAICDRELTDFVKFQWKENQTRLGMQGSLVMTAIKQQLDVIMSAQQKAPETKCIESLFTKLSGSFDETHGGFGGAPRFPQPSTFF